MTTLPTAYEPAPPGFRAALVLVLLAAAGCSDAPADRSAVDPAAGLRVVATLPPLAWLADRVAGRPGGAETLLDGRLSPHATETGPAPLRALERADVWLAVGGDTVPAERAWERVARERTPPPATVRVATGAASAAPHPWLSPAAMRAAADALAAELRARGEEGLDESLGATRAEIDAVERDVRATLDGGPRRFWVDHPAWEAFAESFGLEQVALEREGKEPGPAELAEAARRAKAEGVRALIVARGARHPAAEVFAAETGARTVELDPLAYDWPETMRAAARAIAGAP